MSASSFSNHMLISRRNVLRHIVTGAVTAALPSLVEGAGKTGGPIRLSRNENAYGPSAKVKAAMQEAALNVANRYPDVEAEALRLKIAAHHGVAPDQVVLGAVPAKSCEWLSTLSPDPEKNSSSRSRRSTRSAPLQSARERK